MVAGRKRSPDRGRYGPGLAPNVQNRAIPLVPHDDLGGITRDAARRFRGNVDAVLQRRLAALRVISQDILIDMDDDLIAVAGSTTIEVGRQRALGEQPERVGAPLTHRHGRTVILLRACRANLWVAFRLAIQPIGRGFQRALHDRPDLG